ncbi:MAG: hypothetical protein KDJ90_02375 [Nitratireductor sp.]|nr:hypothetical protein [Nitratireductor sp.]
MTSLRYSRPKFRVTLIVAGAMTAMVSGTVWMLLNVFAMSHATFYATLSALTFFAFVSATMMLRYLRNDVVVAVRPTGLFDARWQAETVAWERIREVVARQRENDVELDVYLWRPQTGRAAGETGGGSENAPDHVIELAPLEGDVGKMIEAIARHARLRIDNLAGPIGSVPNDRLAGAGA